MGYGNKATRLAPGSLTEPLLGFILIIWLPVKDRVKLGLIGIRPASYLEEMGQSQKVTQRGAVERLNMKKCRLQA